MLEKLGIVKEPFELSIKKEEGFPNPIGRIKGNKFSLLAGLSELIGTMFKCRIF